MFDRRLKVLLVVLGLALTAIVVRLGQLQIVRGDHYRRAAEQAVVSRPISLPFVRGSILDRRGEVLVREEPRWDVTLDFEVIAAASASPDAVTRAVKRWKRNLAAAGADDLQVAEGMFGNLLASMWRDLALFNADREPLSRDELQTRARETYDRVMRIRRIVARRRGFDAPVAEETQAHPLLTGLDGEQQVAARGAFGPYPWLHVEASTTRVIPGDATALAHVLGRMGRVDQNDVETDPNAEDPFARYGGTERIGVSGAEYAAEQRLRGRRGQVVFDVEGNLLESQSVAPENGEDVSLTIHAELQRRLYQLLGQTVEDVPESAGGAIVVLSVPTREVLALVSYPSYDPGRFDELYPGLRDDAERLPLTFRAVASRYAPGSTVKPLACLAGLTSGRISTETREECNGYLFPEVRDRWRCWQMHGTTERKQHGSIDVVEALSGSCNVFLYRLGERLGVDRLCSEFDVFGIGRTTGIGLREESRGINPTPAWLMEHKNIRATPGTARLFAIGQGEIAMTPVQVANLMACYAGGKFRPATLIRSPTAHPEWIIPAAAEQWSAIRRGVFGVVNNPEGTAYKYAHVEHPRYVLCGKTGSATAAPRPTAYRVPYEDADGVKGVAVVPAGALRPALERFAEEHPHAKSLADQAEVAASWPIGPPAEGEEFSHAWFGGWLQERDAAGRPDWSKSPSIAFAVLVEYGGSGGRVSGPLARKVVAELLEVLGPNLHFDASIDPVH